MLGRKNASKKAKAPRNNKAKAIVLMSASVLLLTGCATSINTNPDERAVYYKAGAFSSTQFDHCVEPGTLERWEGASDLTYSYPAGLRTYVFTDGGDGPGDRGAYKTLPTKNKIIPTIEGFITFNLTEDCAELQKFHEELGLKDNAYNDGKDGEPGKTSEGWNTLTGKYLGGAMNDALASATSKYTWNELYDDPSKLEAWKKDVGNNLPVNVQNAMGGDYFKNFRVVLHKPTPPADLMAANQKIEVANAEKAAQIAKNNTITEEIRGIKTYVDILGPESYVLLEAIKSNKEIDFVSIPQGGTISPNRTVKAPK